MNKTLDDFATGFQADPYGPARPAITRDDVRHERFSRSLR
jgi:hypothetical protein